ncbi:MAG: hypothetical protein LUG23_03795 [Oscillospiraceae bacterium]|nr:hypothetical protein [Oscillospiraceae bacterium]
MDDVELVEDVFEEEEEPVEDVFEEEEEPVEDVFEEGEEDVVGTIEGEVVYDGESPFVVNIVDPDNVSESAIYVETAEIPEEAINRALFHLANQVPGSLVTLGFTEEESVGASVASAFRAYNGTTKEYYDLFYFPLMYGDTAVAMAISSYNSETDKYSFQMGKDQISDVMNYLETSPENPALFVYFDDISGGFFIITTAAYRLVADDSGSYEIAEEDIPDYIRGIMNREVNPDNVVAIYGAQVATEELIDD